MAALPPALNLPANPITNALDPDRDELNAYLATSTTFRQDCLAQLTVYQPAHGFNTALPANTAANAGQALRVQRALELQVHNLTLHAVYTPARNNFAAAFGVAAAVPAAQPRAPRPPKTKLPTTFTGKSSNTARHFIRECTNYAVISPFADAEQQIRWALQLLDGEAAVWRDETLDEFEHLNVPIHLTTWDDFVDHFNARWLDPHEDEKALDRIMSGQIRQVTSVKKYNDAFNEALGLTAEDATNAFVMRAYEAGLKGDVLNAAIGPLYANPNMTLSAKQALMVRIDENLMRTRSRAAPAPQRRFVINNPVINLPAGQTAAPATARTPTPAPGGAANPIKVEVARQYTRLTDAERESLRRQGGCFRCRQVGHMASQCPRRPQVAAIEVAATTTDTMPPPLPPKDSSAPVPASGF